LEAARDAAHGFAAIEVVRDPSDDAGRADGAALAASAWRSTAKA